METWNSTDLSLLESMFPYFSNAVKHCQWWGKLSQDTLLSSHLNFKLTVKVVNLFWHNWASLHHFTHENCRLACLLQREINSEIGHSSNFHVLIRKLSNGQVYLQLQRKKCVVWTHFLIATCSSVGLPTF